MLNQAQMVPYALCRVQSISWAGGLSPGKQSGPFVCLSCWEMSHHAARDPAGVRWGGSQPPVGLPGESSSVPWSLVVSDSALIAAIKA